VPDHPLLVKFLILAPPMNVKVTSVQ
jgi:hypothetical protein